MAGPPRLMAFLLVALMLVAASSACLSKKAQRPDPPVVADPVQLVADTVEAGLARLGTLRAQPLMMAADITINVVLVGIDPGLIDEAAITKNLPTKYSPSIAYSPAKARGAPLEADRTVRSGLVQNLNYDFHEAPEAFAKDLFAAYPGMSREAPIPRRISSTGAPSTGPPPQDPDFLLHYDQAYALGRAGASMHLVDAAKVEAWIHDHRQGAGLVFPEPEYTVFFLDSWTKHRLWADSYYWYEFTDSVPDSFDVHNMRTWGGTWDFLFMDYSAAPNDSVNDNSAVRKQDVCCGVAYGAGGPEGTAYNDPPMWHYQGNAAKIGKGSAEKTVLLGDRLQHALNVATQIRMVGDYAYRPVFKERYHVNIHLYHDGRSQIPKEGLGTLLSLDRLLPGLQGEVPWATVTASIKTYVLPTDDPGMDAALTQAKAEGAGTYIPVAPVYYYVDAHKERFKQNDPEVFDVMAMLFLLEGDYTFALPHIVGGVAFSGVDGTAWGTFSSQNDARYISGGRDRELVGKSLIAINAHEIGHFFGLTHNHDGSIWDGTRYTDYLDHTWSSSASVMSYRVRPPSTDTFHRDILARAHTLENLEMTLRSADLAYEALAARSIGTLPEPVRALLATASLAYDQARALHRDGAYQEAVLQAIAARRAADDAMRAAGLADRESTVDSWTASMVNSVGAKEGVLSARPGVSPTGIRYDFRPFQIDDQVQRITVRATWTNTPASWGDFFLVWAVEPAASPLQGPVEFHPANTGGLTAGPRIHDEVDEKPNDGAITRDFTLDMDMFPAYRNGATPLWLGAGVQGDAVNGSYKVEIVFTYRSPTP